MRIKLLFIALAITHICYSQKKFNCNQLYEDFDAIVTELKVQHQGIYQYVAKETVDQKIAKLRKKISCPSNRLEFYQIIRQLIEFTNEGHNSVDLPKGAMIKLGLSKSFLPISARFYDKELIITQNFGDDIQGLTKGTKLISINGKSIDELIAKFFPLIPTDGFNETSKYEWVGNINFSLLYRLVYGKTKQFVLEIEEFKTKKRSAINIPAVRFTHFKKKNAKFESKHFAFDDFNFEQINDSIAYLCVPDFKYGVIKYEEFYEKHFKKIATLPIQHLILDIQSNTGGEEGNENLLFSYLMEDRIQKYRKVTMLPTTYEINKNDGGIIEDKWKLKGEMAERGEYTLYSDYYSYLKYTKPKKEDIFKGKVYVLISGLTFSGGAEFASLVKMTNRGIFIGEETGGAYEGNVSGYSETFQLPNTKISVDIPSVHFQINVTPKTQGKGVIPDHHVPQTWDDYMNNRNAKLEFTKQLIMQ